MKFKFIYYIFFLLTLSSTAIYPVVPNQTDNFQTNTAMNWFVGGGNPNPPTATAGGIGGVGDIFIRCISAGGGGAGSRLAIMNQTQWSGNYITAGIQEISMRVNNTGTDIVHLRLAFNRAGGVQTKAIDISPGTGWQSITFNITADSIEAAGNYIATMSAVFEMRIVNSAAPGHQGDPVAAQMDIDDITAATNPLPVELISFSAIQKENFILLNWSTAVEVNNYGYNVEESANAVKWSEAGFVRGNGNSSVMRSYSFSDQSPSLYYRLRIVDINGSYKYSPVINAGAGALNSFALLQNYPNPFNPGTTITYSVPFNSPVTVRIYNAVGKEVSLLVNKDHEKGVYSAYFNAEALSTGVYFCQMNAGSYSSTRKLILMK